MKKEEKFLKLITEKIKTEDQKNKFIELMNRDVEKFSESIIETYINGINYNVSKVEEKRNFAHDPIKTLKFFDKFINNHIYKYTTHLWDVKSVRLESYEKFIDEINHKETVRDLNELFNINRLTYNHINNFLGNPINKETFWMYYDKIIYIGWQTPEEVWEKNKSLKYVNRDSLIDLNECLNEWSKKNNKNTGLKFEEVINLFKKTIRVNEDENNGLKDIIDKAIKVIDINNDLQIIYKEDESLDDIYLNTVVFYKLITSIFSEIKQFLDQGKKNVEIEIKNNRENECVEIYIKHVDSYPDKKLDLNRIKSFFRGDSFKKFNYIFSNFDYEVSSDFKIDGIENRVPYSLLIFEKESTICKINKQNGNVDEIVNEIKAKKLNQNIGGFLHKIKIYY
jgi:hypothetical protein